MNFRGDDKVVKINGVYRLKRDLDYRLVYFDGVADVVHDPIDYTEVDIVKEDAIPIDSEPEEPAVSPAWVSDYEDYDLFYKPSEVPDNVIFPNQIQQEEYDEVRANLQLSDYYNLNYIDPTIRSYLLETETAGYVPPTTLDLSDINKAFEDRRIQERQHLLGKRHLSDNSDEDDVMNFLESLGVNSKLVRNSNVVLPEPEKVVPLKISNTNLSLKPLEATDDYLLSSKTRQLLRETANKFAEKYGDNFIKPDKIASGDFKTLVKSMVAFVNEKQNKRSNVKLISLFLAYFKTSEGVDLFEPRIFTWFCLVNNQIKTSTDNTISVFNEWRSNLQRYVSNPNHRFIPDSIRFEVLGLNDVLLHRLTKEITVACINFITMTGQPPTILNGVRKALYKGQFTRAIALFEDDTEDSTSIIGDDILNGYWILLLFSFIVCKRLWSYDIRLVDFMRKNNDRYFERIVQNEGREIKLIEAFPFLITSDDQDMRNPDFKSISDSLLAYLKSMTLKPLKVLEVNLRMKRVQYKDNIEKDDGDLEDKYWVLRFNYFKIFGDHYFNNKDYYDNMFEVIKDRSDGAAGLLNYVNLSDEIIKELSDFKLRLDTITPIIFNEIFCNIVDETLETHFDRYKEDLIDPIDEFGLSRLRTGLMISKFDVFAQTLDVNKEAFNQFTRQMPVHCTSTLVHIFHSLGLYSELLGTFGICLWEAHWSALNHHKFDKNGSLRRLETRREACLSDFSKLDKAEMAVYIYGDLQNYDDYLAAEASTKLIILEEGVISNFADPNYDFGYDPALQPLLCYDGHVILTSWQKLFDVGRETILKVYKSRKDMLKSIKKNAKKNGELVPDDTIVGMDVYSREKYDEVSDEKRNKKHNYFFDIETCSDENGVMIPYLIVVVSEHLSSPKCFWGLHTCVDSFLEFYSTLVPKVEGQSRSHRKKKPLVYFWSFNGCKFDLMFLIRRLAQWPNFKLVGSLTDIKHVSINDNPFHDLMKILPRGSLKKQAEKWNTTHRKTEFDHDNMTPDSINNISEALKKKAIDYCINDCIVLQEVFFKFKSYCVTHFKISPYVISSAALAMNTYRTSLNNGTKRSLIVSGVPLVLYPKLLSSYKGGMVFLTQKELQIGEKAYFYDINSSYPAVMATQKMPIKYNQYIKFNNPITLPVDTLEVTNYYLYEIGNFTWDDDHWLPLIPRRTVDGLRYEKKLNPIEYIWGIELYEAMKSNKIKSAQVYGYHSFVGKDIFKKYIKDLYNKRLEAKRNGDGLEEDWLKLLMNSVYGKFGQKLYPTKQICTYEKMMYYLGLTDHDLLISNIKDLGGDLFELSFFELDYTKQIGSCIQIASFITAGGRANLSRGVRLVSDNFKLKNVMYGDTDSLVTKTPLPEGLLHNQELGKWKLEHVIVEWIGIAPKVYWLRNENDYVKMKFKGLHDSNLTKEDYQDLLNQGKKLIASGDKWIRLKVGGVQKVINKKLIQPNNRRIFIDNFTSQPK